MVFSSTVKAYGEKSFSWPGVDNEEGGGVGEGFWGEEVLLKEKSRHSGQKHICFSALDTLSSLLGFLSMLLSAEPHSSYSSAVLCLPVGGVHNLFCFEYFLLVHNYLIFLTVHPAGTELPCLHLYNFVWLVTLASHPLFS